MSSPDPLFNLNNYLLYKSYDFPYLKTDVPDDAPEQLHAYFNLIFPLIYK